MYFLTQPPKKDGKAKDKLRKEEAERKAKEEGNETS